MWPIAYLLFILAPFKGAIDTITVDLRGILTNQLVPGPTFNLFFPQS